MATDGTKTTNGANGNGKAAARTKAPTDYAKMLDDWELRADGLEMRRDRAERELRKLLGGHQNANQIMQIITRPGDGYGATVGKLAIADAQVKRYARLLADNTVTPVETVPTAPPASDTPADLVASA